MESNSQENCGKRSLTPAQHADMRQRMEAYPTVVIGFGARLSLADRDPLARIYKMPRDNVSTDQLGLAIALGPQCGPRDSAVNRQLLAEHFFSRPTTREASARAFDHGINGTVINGIETDGYKLTHDIPQLLGTTGHEPIATQDPPITEAEAFQTILENIQPATTTK